MASKGYDMEMTENEWPKRWETIKDHLQKRRVLIFLLVLFIIFTFVLIIGLAVAASRSSDKHHRRHHKDEPGYFGIGAFDARNVRRYYLQAEKVEWDYLPSGENLVDNDESVIHETLTNGNTRVGSKFTKYIYKGFTDGTFSTLKPTPEAQGYLGPTIKGEVGETIRVHFRNHADIPLSVHPHGVRYDKGNEGALQRSDPSDNANTTADDLVQPGTTFVYTWDINANFAPTVDDPNCVPFVYHSHVDPVHGVNSGLVGVLLVCKPGTLYPDGSRQDVDREHVLYFDAIDEGMSWLVQENLGRCQNPTECHNLFESEDEDFVESLKKDSINGYMFGNVPGLEVCAGERVVWYIFSLNAELHPVAIHGHTFEHQHHRSSVIGIWPATFVSAQTTSSKPGRWLVSCMNAEHSRNGMTAFLTVKNCNDSTPKADEHLSGGTALHQFFPGAKTDNEHLSGNIRKFYLSAETEVWDYAPSGENMFDGGSLTGEGKISDKYFSTTNNRIGGKYKKARFHQYSDSSFKTKASLPHPDRHLGLLGPVIRAEVGDIIDVTLYNKLTHPVSFYLQGVSLDKSQDGLWVKGPEDSQMSGHIITSGATGSYNFTVPWSASPGANDPDCIAYIYYSAYDVERDISSGLVGPLLICRPGTISEFTGRQEEREIFLFYSAIDENQSWYIDENINVYTTGNIDKNDEDFVESNIMSSINGRSYGNLANLAVCKGTRVAWHVLSFGQTEGLHGVTFNGNNVKISGTNRDSHISISALSFSALMDVENIGKWSIYCHNNDHFEAGMKAIYTVDHCGNQEPAYQQVSGVTRTYYIAAVERPWNYSPKTMRTMSGEDYSNPKSAQYLRIQKDGKFIGSNYTKALYREFTDATFTSEVPVDDNTLHLGLLGPFIRANVGDTIKVGFKNMASKSYSIHPHGVSYSKESEGMVYGTENSNLAGNSVPPGSSYTYTWTVPQTSGPAPDGPNCIGSLYHSAVDPPKDTNSGLVGPLVICKAGVLGPNNNRTDSVEREFALLFHAFDENKSWYIDENIRNAGPLEDMTSSKFEESNMYDSINGFIFGNLQGLVMNRGENVLWYLLGLGASEDIHSVHFHGQSVIRRTDRAHIADVIEVFPGTYETVEMFAENPGTWMIHCHVSEHAHDGMIVTYTIK